MENLEKIMANLYELAIVYGLKLLLALVTLVIGLWILKKLIKGIGHSLEKKDVDATLRQFLLSLLSILLKIMLIISVISMLGVEMTSFVAILAAAGLAVGMALSGTLQNFAGGIIIVLFKPYKVGDFIDAQGYSGTVKEIQIFNTILTTPDNKTVVIPNGGLSNSALTNYSTEEKRRVDFSFGIGYGDDIDKARKIIEGLIGNDNRILPEPAPFIAVSELADSSVKFAVRVWALSSDYWDIHFDMIEKVKKAFDDNSISIPFPQRDIHIYNEK